LVELANQGFPKAKDANQKRQWRIWNVSVLMMNLVEIHYLFLFFYNMFNKVSGKDVKNFLFL
jgi:hypothetical protein